MESPAQPQKPPDRRIWALNPTEREVHEIQQARINEWRTQKIKTAAYMDELESFVAGWEPEPEDYPHEDHLDVRHHDFDAKAWWEREYPWSGDETFEQYVKRQPMIYQPKSNILHIGPGGGTHEDLMKAAGIPEREPYDWHHGWVGFDAQGHEEHGGPLGTEENPEFNGWGWNAGWDSPGDYHEQRIEQALGVPKAHNWSFKASWSPEGYNFDPYRAEEECYNIAEGIAMKHPELKQEGGFYHGGNESTDRHAHHSWNMAPDGTIVDATSGQFGGPEIVPPNHPDYGRYIGYRTHPEQAMSIAHHREEHGEGYEDVCPECRDKVQPLHPPLRASKVADTWQPKTIWPNPMSDLDMPIGGDPTMPPCTCEEGNKLECPVHGLHAQVPAYEHELTVRNPNSPAGKDYSGEAPRTWMRAQTKVAADEFDTREYQDSRMMAPMTQPPNATNPHPEKKGCTCEEGRKLDCPVHGMNPTEDKYDHSWSIPESNPVGYPQDQPRNYMTSEGRLQERGDENYPEPDREAEKDVPKESADNSGEADEYQRKGIDVHDDSIPNCKCMACLKASERGWHMQQPGQEGSGWTGIPRADV